MTLKRPQGDSGFYHITARGNGKQIMFNDDDDFSHYLGLLEKYNKNLQIEIVAYCLMNNHVHILIYDPKFNMDKLIRMVHSMYTRHFNYKYERVGSLFQGRFESKVIKDDKQLLAVLRYVLKNPSEAGICESSKYKWSSYRFYGERKPQINTGQIDCLLGSFANFEALINSKDDNCEYRHFDVNENLLKHVVMREFQLDLTTSVKSFSKKKRDQIVLYLNSKGATYKQIVRLTGVPYGIVLRIISGESKSQIPHS